MNTRMVEKVIPGMKKIMSTQANLSQQIEELKASLPALSGTIEKNHVESTRKIRAVDGKLSNLKMELNRFKKEAAAQQDKFKIGLAGDIEQFSKTNQNAFKNFSNKNAQNLGVIEKHLQAQNERINRSVETLSELGQLEINNGQTLTATLNAVQSGNAETKAGFATIEANQKVVVNKNNQMIDLLGKSFKEQQTVTGKVDAVLAGQVKTNENVNVARETITAFKGMVDSRMGEISQGQRDSSAQIDKVAQSTDLIKNNLLVSDTKMNKLAGGLKTLQGQNMTSVNSMNSVQEKVIKMQVLNQQTHEKFNQLIDTTKAMLANAAGVDKKVEQSLQKIDAGRTENNLTNQKISKLITILKNIAVEQDKLKQILASQAEIKGAVKDLRNKANVNISRNDKILKALGKPTTQRKSPSKKR